MFDMNVQEQIKEYITSQTEPKHSDMQTLHHSYFNYYQDVSYGSMMEKTLKIKPLVTLL